MGGRNTGGLGTNPPPDGGPGGILLLGGLGVVNGGGLYTGIGGLGT